MTNPEVPYEDAPSGSAKSKQSPQPTNKCSERPYTKSLMHRAYRAILQPPYLFRALHISIVTSTDRAIVVGYRDSKISQSIPSKIGLSLVHLMKFLCRHRRMLVNTGQSSVGRGRLIGGTWGTSIIGGAVKYPTTDKSA